MATSNFWTCPECGRIFVQRNQWHSCGRYTVQRHLDKASPQVRALYDRFVKIVNNCGDVIIEATKTSIAFKSPGLFAVVHIQKRGLKVDFWLPRRIDHPRITCMEGITPQEYVHAVRISLLADLDDQLQNWLCEAYATKL
jgi:hypothetical protein